MTRLPQVHSNLVISYLCALLREELAHRFAQPAQHSLDVQPEVSRQGTQQRVNQPRPRLQA